MLRGERFFPVSSCCIAPRLICCFLAIFLSKAAINASVSLRAVAMAVCSVGVGTGNNIFDNCVPFVNALVVYVQPCIIEFLTFLV